MGLSPGVRLGPYEIVSLLGSGGMGEVYKGRDVRLGRDVAIKVLPAAYRADPERLIRFEQEARAAAALSHANIVSVYDVGHHDAVPYIVSELLDGDTLRARLLDGPRTLRKAVEYAVQIARGLAAAHERGIVHRDLKPENIFLTTDERVKILDFGLAKLTQSEPGAGLSSAMPTTPPQTSPGVVLGTIGYMSPEQVRGLAADHRSDIFALGVILYEMLSGQRAFSGETAMDTMTAILREDPPDLPTVERHIPPALERIVERCMAKSPASRFKSADDLAFALEAFSSYSDPKAAAGITAPSRRSRVTVGISAAIATAAAIAAYAAWGARPAPAPPLPVARFTIALPAGDRFSNTGVNAVAISPDGHQLVYTANSRLYRRSLDQLETTPIRGTEVAPGPIPAPARNPFFSPDGRWIGFWKDGRLKKVSIDGGAPVDLCVAENPWGPTWTTENTILYGQSVESVAGIWRVSGEGGTPEQIVKLETDQVAQGPQLLPGGRAILFTLARRFERGVAQIVVQSLDTGTRHVVLDRGYDARYVPTGHLVYVFEGTLFAVPFDVKTFAVAGSAVPLVGDVARQNVVAHFAIATQGTLVYLPSDAVGGPPGFQRTLAWVDRQGRELPIKSAPLRPYFYPRFSPDGTQVALDIRDLPSGDVWIWDVARETLTRLTLGPTFDQYPVWTPDGEVIFASSEAGGPSGPRSLLRMAADGTGTVDRLAEPTVAQFPSTVTPDGSSLVVRVETRPANVGALPGYDLVLLSLDGDHRARPLLNGPYDELNADVSPDGRWVAYQSNESGRHEIYVRPFPNVEAGRRQASTSGGVQPLWARNGRELFYVASQAVMRVPVTLAPRLELGIPAKLFDGPYLFSPRGGGVGRMYDITPDGQRFLVVKESAAEEAPPMARIILVQNWFEELKLRVPAN